MRTQNRDAPWWLGPILLGIILGAVLLIWAWTATEAEGQEDRPPVPFNWENALARSTESQSLRPGTGYNAYPDAPDPWVAMGEVLGVERARGPEVHTEPSSDAKLTALAASYGVELETAFEALAAGRQAFRGRYGSYPPGTTGATRPHPPCEQHGPDFWRVVLESLCKQGRFGAGWSCQATILETTDAEWACPRHLACEYQASQPGGTPEDPIIQSPPGREAGERWTGQTGFGCTVYFQAPGESEPDPPPPPPDDDDPEPPPEDPEPDPETCPDCPPAEAHALCGPGGPCERLAAEVEIALLTPRWGIGPNGTAVKSEDGRYLGFRRRFLDKFAEWAEACREREVYCPTEASTGRVEIELTERSEER